MIGIMLGEAVHAMAANRLRTGLTMLGMVIGVAAVVLMLAIGRGVEYSVSASIASMGANLLMVVSGSAIQGGVRMGSGAAPTLTLGDAEAIGELPGVQAVAPSLPDNGQVVYGPANWNTQVLGTTPDYLEIRDWALEAGHPFTDSDLRSATRVAVIGQTVAANLFGSEHPVGHTIRIKGSPFLVLGLLAKKGQSLDGRDQDDTILVPVTTAQRKLVGTQFSGTVRFIMTQAESGAAVPAVERAVTELLRQRHRIRTPGEEDFSVRNLAAAASTAAETTELLSLLLGAVASISLVVGGIGIMNIMLVSVTERTREIGIRMAIGARGRDILLQFLLESIVISLSGCLAGAVLGVTGAVLVSRLFDITVVITAGSIALGFTVAAAIGVFFGLYPARKAALMHPIEALRYA
ncbi:MAG: ABC transporter permease [Gammaproteobacteria bacterium]